MITAIIQCPDCLPVQKNNPAFVPDACIVQQATVIKNSLHITSFIPAISMLFVLAFYFLL